MNMSEMKISESIVTTLNDEGAVHPAPFGFVRMEGLIRIAPFRPSRSLDYLMKRREAVLNLTDDPLSFAGCLTRRHEFEFIPAQKIKGFVLKNAVSWYEMKLEKVKEDEMRPHLFFKIIGEHRGVAWQGYHRGRGAIIEACVLLSRLHLLEGEFVAQEMARLEDIVMRTQGENELRAWSWLTDYYDQWQSEHSS